MHVLFLSQAIVYLAHALNRCGVLRLDLNNRLESIWTPDMFGDMMAMNNPGVREDRVFRQIASTRHLERQL